MTWIALVAGLAACRNDDPTRPIEITGYLDPTRMELVATAQVDALDEVDVNLTARAGAASGDTAVSVRNDRSGETVEVDPVPDGSFVASLSALEGDHIGVAQAGAESLDLTVAALATFPSTKSLTAHAPDGDGIVVVTVTFHHEQPTDWIFVVADPDTGAVVELDRTTDVELIGELVSASGNELWVHARTTEGTGTLAATVPVP